MNHQEVRNQAAQLGIMALSEPGTFTPAANPKYNFRKEMFIEMVGFFLMGKTAMKLMGFKGCGKTSVVEEFHAALNYPLLTVSCTPRTEAQDLIGKMIPTPEGLKFAYGPLVIAAQAGCSVLLDEYNVIDPGEAVGVNQLLQSGSLYIPETGEVIRPNPGFRVFATCNPADQSAGLFGRNEQDDANNDRFWTVWVDYPSPEEETPIIQSVLATRFDDDTSKLYAGKMVEVANRIRKAFMGESNDGNALETTLSTRGLLAWAQGMTVFYQHPTPIYFTLDRSVLNALPRQSTSRVAIHEFVKDAFGA